MSGKSATQTLSLKDDYTFLYQNIWLLACKTSANDSYDILFHLIADIDRACLTTPSNVSAPEDFLSKHV